MKLKKITPLFVLFFLALLASCNNKGKKTTTNESETKTTMVETTTKEKTTTKTSMVETTTKDNGNETSTGDADLPWV